MDLNLIEQASEAYEPQLGDNDRARMSFFKGLWKLQQEYVERAQASLDHALPGEEQLLAWYWDEKPLFLMAPLTINEELFLSALKDCAGYVADNAGVADEAVSVLRGFDWKKLLNEVGLEQAGYDPGSWLVGAVEAAAKLIATQASTVEAGVDEAGAVGIVLSCALKPMLEPAAKQAMSHYKPDRDAYESHAKPLRCPVCGGHAGLAYVGDTPSGEGKGRMLYCTTCTAHWEFERIRCAHCGTQSQGKLHYFHVEGDPAHRLYLCDECSSYLRTAFLSELPTAFCMEVEDVIMARLDHVANSVAIKSQRKDS
ncbi:MAG TPA: hypothetical protein DEB24_07495 [Coriobacteriia bacterium]|nr:hypothetical protein [Coriobacteriia bacterium]